jgi:hypothetical protein
MAREQLGVGLSAIVMIAMHSAALAAPPAIATNWAATSWTQEQCFARAEATLTELGYPKIQSSKFSRFVETGDYTLVIQCLTEQKLILFMTAGPTRADVQKYQAQLFDKF